ncbi:MAG: SAM-dependent methyltransferase, type 11 [Ilumatobacteraceae bacterium]|nr:SAM-dependent methyltransferase, type 11 [Ilumatobacteraceae bacterium]
MNIGDKPRLFAEMRRVARPGARLAFFDILAGPVQPIDFPVPWAVDQSDSFLATPDETRDMLTANRFAVRTWQDITPEAIEFFDRLSQAPAEPSPLGLQLLIENVPLKLGNLRRNAQEDRIRVVRCIADAVD